jgi:hypothetical protein
MASSDRVEQFFDELGRRGHEPLLDRFAGSGRFEVRDDGGVDYWQLMIRDGYVTVSPAGDDKAEVDWVVRVRRHELERIIHGEPGALAALIRGTLDVDLGPRTQQFALLTRLFAGPEESRKRWVPDPALDEQDAR